MRLDLLQVKKIIKAALDEDIGSGDITSNALFPAASTAAFRFTTREDVIVCGAEIVKQAFHMLDKKIKVRVILKDGARAKKGAAIIEVSGNAKALLAGERVTLNLLQRMCGIATGTDRFVKAVKGTKVKILDTRKTMPGLKILDKYAVTVGGGTNHRMGLYDEVLIKDNHLAYCGSITEAVKKVRAKYKNRYFIVVECDDFVQVKEALATKPGRILLDNMSIKDLKRCVRYVNGKVPMEASGGVNLDNVRQIANTGVDCISIGALTHSVKNSDIGLDEV